MIAARTVKDMARELGVNICLQPVPSCVPQRQRWSGDRYRLKAMEV